MKSQATRIRRISQKEILAFQRKILRFYRLKGRDLPFRRTRNPYSITVAEIMLQQTQVDRVVPKWKNWMRAFPNWRALANASKRSVLSAWSGLGYNRRAVYLHSIAQEIVTHKNGKLPEEPEALLRLPGIGPYTARSILIFAFNTPLVTIDTNIRRVLLHEFSLPGSLSNHELEAVAQRLLPKSKSRDWHNALMDYASLEMQREPGNGSVSRQSTFHGSIRQIRGRIIKELTMQKSISQVSIAKKMHRTLQDIERATQGLKKDKLVTKKGNRLFLNAS